MGRPRPFRAIAYRPDWSAPRGRRRVVVGRVAACTREGLDRWIARQQAEGNDVDVLEILSLENVDKGSQSGTMDA